MQTSDQTEPDLTASQPPFSFPLLAARTTFSFDPLTKFPLLLLSQYGILIWIEGEKKAMVVDPNAGWWFMKLFFTSKHNNRWSIVLCKCVFICLGDWLLNSGCLQSFYTFKITFLAAPTVTSHKTAISRQHAIIRSHSQTPTVPLYYSQLKRNKPAVYGPKMKLGIHAGNGYIPPNAEVTFKALR